MEAIIVLICSTHGDFYEIIIQSLRDEYDVKKKQSFAEKYHYINMFYN